MYDDLRFLNPAGERELRQGVVKDGTMESVSNAAASTLGLVSREVWAKAVQWLDQADGLVITAGAGMGVDSGLPDFRGNEGLWRAYPALGQARLDFTRIASPAAFRRDPLLAWGFYGHRLSLYRATKPHDGFAILRRWSQRMKRGSFVYTSNVDGQFQAAGFGEDRIVECHGTLHWLQCLDACHHRIWSAEGVHPEVDMTACRMVTSLPACPCCGGLARPNVLMFSDGEWISTRTDAQLRRLEAWLGRVKRPVVMELGAGTAVPTVRWFGASLHAPIIRINLRESAMGRDMGVGLPGRALETLAELDRRWNGA